MYEDSDAVRLTVHDSILEVVLDRPGKRNALRDGDVVAVSDALVTANNDEQVRAIVITGANGDFCTGADIVNRNLPAAVRPRVGAIARRLPSLAHRLIPQIMAVQVPVVAAVCGYAVGLGMQIALAADFVVVADDAVLWEPFSARAMGPDGGASWLLPRLVGAVRARELLLLGRRLSGVEAVEWGLAHQAVASSEVDAAAGALAQRLAAGPSVALGITKLLVNQGTERTLVDHLSQEAYGMEIASRSPDFHEGLAAFVERRPPEFTGR